MSSTTGNLWDTAAEGACTRMNRAWRWLREQRKNAPEGADSWDIRWQVLNTGPEWLTDLTHRVLRGEYRLAPLQLQGKNENRKAVWGARDALVLKWTALSLQHLLPLHPSCEHVKGHGGGRVSILKLHGLLTQDKCDHGDEKKTSEADTHLRVNAGLNGDTVQTVVNSRQYPWVCRTDIRGYYRHIDKQTLINQVRQHVPGPVLRDLVEQYIHYTVEDSGTFHTPEKGISRGCPLSPLMGALHLYDMDEHFAKQKNIHYARYMDDFIILAKSRQALRRHTKRLMQWFKDYGFEAHPDKTYIGRTGKGFDWMGVWLTHEGVVDIAPRAKASHREKVRRLYERLARVPLWRRKRARQEVLAKVSKYRTRWTIWAAALLALTSQCSPAAPLIVIASGNVAGDTGARFLTSGSSGVTVQSGDYGGLCISTTGAYCSGSPSIKAVKTDLGWGFQAWDTSVMRGLALVPSGSLRLQCASCSSDTVATLNPATGDAVTKGGQPYHACEPVSGDSGFRATFRTGGIRSECSDNPVDANPNMWPLDGAPATLSWDLSLAAVALQPLLPGTVAFPTVNAAIHTRQSLSRPLDVPSGIVVSGLICGIGTTTPTSIDLGSVPTGGTGAGGVAASQRLIMYVRCSGTNSLDPSSVVNTAISFVPGPGMATSGASRDVLSAGDQPGYYGVIKPGSTAGCTGGVALDGTSPTLLHKYEPGETGGIHAAQFIFSLCSTGKPQATGDYALKATARLVNY